MDTAPVSLGFVLVVGPTESASELQAVLTGHGWGCQHHESTSGVLARLREQPVIDMVLLVPDGELHAYTELCRQIKFDSRTGFVSVIFALSAAQTEHRSAVFAAGADDCLQLPAPPVEIILRLTNATRMKRATDSLEDATAVITSLANAIEGRDYYTRGHVERVAAYAVEIGRRLGLPDSDLAVLRIGGIVHDIGKIAVPDQILNKPGGLTPAEWEVVKRHPLVGYDILQPLRTFRNVLPIVRWHHERPNGTGYPDGVAGTDLPLPPRIVAVADIFDALSTARSYRPAYSTEKCRALLLASAAAGDVDAMVVEALLEIVGRSVANLGAVPAPSGTAMR